MFKKNIWVFFLWVWASGAFAKGLEAKITIENMTSVQLGHSSILCVSVMGKRYVLLPDAYETIGVPIGVPISLKLESLSYEGQDVSSALFYDCKKTISLQQGQAIEMYMVGKVPDGPIECRYQ